MSLFWPRRPAASLAQAKTARLFERFQRGLCMGNNRHWGRRRAGDRNDHHIFNWSCPGNDRRLPTSPNEVEAFFGLLFGVSFGQQVANKIK